MKKKEVIELAQQLIVLSLKLVTVSNPDSKEAEKYADVIFKLMATDLVREVIFYGH